MSFCTLFFFVTCIDIKSYSYNILLKKRVQHTSSRVYIYMYVVI